MVVRKFEIHMHSTFSDGEFSPTELVGIARKNGVSILSLTDRTARPQGGTAQDRTGS